MQDTILESRTVGTLTRRGESSPMARGMGLAVLLAAEALVLTLSFDLEDFAQDGRWWVGLLRQSSFIPPLVVAVAVATLAFRGQRIQAALRRLPNDRGLPHRAGLFLIGHLLAFAGFAAATAWIWGESVQPTPAGGAKLLIWALAGLTTTVLWGASALPIALWLGLLARCTLGILAVGGLVGVAAWSMGQWTRSFWTPLSRSTFWVVEHLLRLAFRDVVCDPAELLVGTSTFSVSIAPQCSGYEGIGLIWVFLLGALGIFRRQFRFPRAWLLIPIGTAFIWVANTVRIAGLIAVGTLLSPEIAVGGFHSIAGWLGFNLVGLGLIASAQRCRFFLNQAPEPGVAARTNPTAAYLMPLLALVATAMMTGAFTVGFDRYYPFRMVAVVAVFAWYRKDYAALRPTWSGSGIAIGVAVFVLWMILETRHPDRATGFDPSQELAPAWDVAWVLARVLGSVLIVPLAEELAFRGYLIRRLIAADFQSVPTGRFTWGTLALSSVAFGALHGRWLAGTLAGIGYALALYRRGKLEDAVLAHAVTNALIAAYVLATGTWSLWS